MSLSRMASMSERENREIKAANASGRTPVVFIHGLWLLPGSWANWADLFTQAGYAPLTPDWPDDPIPNRGHSLTIDHGWREVAQTALDFVERFASPSDTARTRS